MTVKPRYIDIAGCLSNSFARTYGYAMAGGITVAAGTHRDAEPWMPECRAVIQNGRTCKMAQLSPDCHDKLNNISKVVLWRT